MIGSSLESSEQGNDVTQCGFLQDHAWVLAAEWTAEGKQGSRATTRKAQVTDLHSDGGSAHGSEAVWAQKQQD